MIINDNTSMYMYYLMISYSSLIAAETSILYTVDLEGMIFRFKYANFHFVFGFENTKFRFRIA